MQKYVNFFLRFLDAIVDLLITLNLQNFVFLMSFNL